MADAGERKLEQAYREPKASDAPGPPPDNVLAYFPEALQQRGSIGVYAIFGPFFCLAAVAGLSGSLGLGALAFVACLAYVLWKRRRLKTVPRAVFTVQGSALTLSGDGFRNPRTIELADLLEVYLDTKTIQRVQESPGPIPDLRFINATVSGEHDSSRIGLELEHETLFLTEERVSHTDANEWFSKIRRFLRKHGWVPEDER